MIEEMNFLFTTITNNPSRGRNRGRKLGVFHSSVSKVELFDFQESLVHVSIKIVEFNFDLKFPQQLAYQVFKLSRTLTFLVPIFIVISLRLVTTSSL